MLKSRKVKNILTNTIFRGLSLVNRFVPKDENRVLLYSNMGFRDNVAYIYDYMIENGYNQKYRIYRSQNENYEGEIPENTKIISNVKAVLTYLRAGHVFYAFGKLPIYPGTNQKVVQMWHGSPFKGADVNQISDMGSEKSPSYYTNVFSTAECFSKFWCMEHHCRPENISICGHPRTDVMCNPYTKKELGMEQKKIILWMPTFRQSKILGYKELEETGEILPVLKNEEFHKIDDFLVSQNVVLWVKLHPMQDLTQINTKEYKNLFMQSAEEFNRLHLDLYRLLGSVDALITDYSSVFYDFMLVNKPIGFTVDDMQEYGNERGFAVSNPEHYMTGDKISTLQDLQDFIRSIVEENDTWKELRNQVNQEVNRFRDYQNCRRALQIGGVDL